MSQTVILSRIVVYILRVCVSDAAGAQVMDTAAVDVERRPGSSTTG